MSAEATVEGLARELSSYLDTTRINQVRRAYYYAEQAHEGQMRKSGDRYITHPLAVAHILADLRLDHQSLMAAMLHDVIEDTGIPKDALAEQFGDDVAELVDGVSKLTQIEFRSRAEAQAENFQKMTLAMARDIRVILVKLADRLHNMRTLGPMPYEKRQRIATETLDIYAPIANRLGMHSICTELEDLGFTSLYPMRSRYISKAVDKLRGSHREIIEDIRGKLQEKLEERGLPGRILGREKHLNSIYNKMKFKQKSFHEIMDVYAFRIITDTEDDCYRILGAVHSLYKPLPGRFKDYIAMPKANGYQSIHTTLFGMHVNIEIQIRTEEMEHIANNGIAAHWMYKNEPSSVTSANQARVDRWVKGLMEMRERADDSMEFIEHVKVDLFPDEIRFHPERPHHGVAKRGNASRLCLCHPHGHRQRHRSLSNQPQPGFPQPASAEWPDRGNHHCARRPPQPGLAQFRGDRQGPEQYPARAQEPEARGIAGARSHPAEEIPERVWCETFRDQRRPEASRGEPQSGEQF